MANEIRIKRSAVQNKQPTTSDLNLGELAVNTYDGKAFMKTQQGSDVEIVEIGGTLSSLDCSGDIDIGGGPGNGPGVQVSSDGLLITRVDSSATGAFFAGYADGLTTGDLVYTVESDGSVGIGGDENAYGIYLDSVSNDVDAATFTANDNSSASYLFRGINGSGATVFDVSTSGTITGGALTDGSNVALMNKVVAAANGSSSDYATAAQGTLADSALQAGDPITDLVNDAGYVVESNAVDYARQAANSLEQNLLAVAGQPARTILAVGATTSGKVQGVSLSDGNTIEVYASGTTFAAKTVLYREFMSKGEVICFTGLSDGAIITSTGGFYGCSEQINGNYESPMPLLSLGLAFTETFLYAFRNSNNFPGNGVNTGQISVVNGPLPSAVTLLKRSDGVLTPVQNQENIALNPFATTKLYTNGNGEYVLRSSNVIMACVQAYMGDTPGDSSARFYDARLVMPLTNDGITWPRSGYVSAPYNDTMVDYFVRDGAAGEFEVDPGSPVDFDGTTGANDADYEPNGATRVRATGLITGYSGADSAGLEASPLMPVTAMAQIVAQPFFIADTGDGGSSGVAIASPYKGTAKVYEWDTTTGAATLAYTVPLNRGVDGDNVPVTDGVDQTTDAEKQPFPCAGLVANEPDLSGDPSVIELVGDLGPGYVEADVPITVVSQNGDPSAFTNTVVRSENGTTTSPIFTDKDESLMLGWTPDTLKAQIKQDTTGLLRRLELSSTGAVSYPAC